MTTPDPHELELIRPFLANRVFVMVYVLHALQDLLTDLVVDAGVDHRLGGPTRGFIDLDGHRYVLTIEPTTEWVPDV